MVKRKTKEVNIQYNNSYVPRETPMTKQEIDYRKWQEIQNRKDPFYTLPFYIKYGILIGFMMGMTAIMFGIVIGKELI